MRDPRAYILANENRVCECGHLWLHHKVRLSGDGFGGACEHWGCETTRRFRKSACRRFRDTGLVFERDHLEMCLHDKTGRVYRPEDKPDCEECREWDALMAPRPTLREREEQT